MSEEVKGSSYARKAYAEERSWLGSWQGTMQEEEENQLDIAEGYEMMTGM